MIYLNGLVKWKDKFYFFAMETSGCSVVFNPSLLRKLSKSRAHTANPDYCIFLPAFGDGALKCWLKFFFIKKLKKEEKAEN